MHGQLLPVRVVELRDGKTEDVLRAYHTGVSVPPQGSAHIKAEFIVPNALEKSGAERTYRLRVLRQPFAFADFYNVRVVPPAGWDAQGTTTFAGPLVRDLVLDVKLHRTTRGRIVETLFAGPWREARSLVHRIF